uniref:Uncharacterized protein n=1 Tax=Glossina pallidipes TaxID=7398 RepID=A0A1A9ZGT5_GLOPL
MPIRDAYETETCVGSAKQLIRKRYVVALPPNMCTEQSTNASHRPSAMPIINPNINREGKQIVTRSRRKSLITDFNCAERTVSESPGRKPQQRLFYSNKDQLDEPLTTLVARLYDSVAYEKLLIESNQNFRIWNLDLPMLDFDN